MKRPNEKIISDALNFAARWGFLSQNIFFEFLCPLKHVQRYNYWSHLVSAGLFLTSKSDRKVLILSKKSRDAMGGSIRPARSHFYIKHDETVARIYLALECRGLILESWLEDELMRNPIQAYSALGVQSIQRLPDLVFDLKSQSGKPVRCALEIERFTKSRVRYLKMAMAYLNSGKVDIVLIGCAQSSTENSVRRAFSSRAHIESQKTPGTFLYDEFDPHALMMQIRFQSSEMSFERFLEIATKSIIPKTEQTANKHRTPVRSLFHQNKTVA